MPQTHCCLRLLPLMELIVYTVIQALNPLVFSIVPPYPRMASSYSATWCYGGFINHFSHFAKVHSHSE